LSITNLFTMFSIKRKKKNVPENVQELAERFRELERENRQLKERMDRMEKEKQGLLQNLGVVRFKPFPGSGGDQSFSLAITDGKGDGVVVTSIYSKNINRVYAKPLRKGISEHSLSAEEERAIGISRKENE